MPLNPCIWDRSELLVDVCYDGLINYPATGTLLAAADLATAIIM